MAAAAAAAVVVKPSLWKDEKTTETHETMDDGGVQLSLSCKHTYININHFE